MTTVAPAWAAFPQLQLERKVGFGKHRDKTCAEVLESDPGWLLWLRQQRWKDLGGDTNSDVNMSSEIHMLLDEFLDGNTSFLNKGYKFRNSAPPPIEFSQAEKVSEGVSAESLDGWGSY